jgi:hypothetical protein
MRQGEEAIKKELANLSILEEAQSSAEDIVREFYRSLGFETVIIKSKLDQ